MIDFVKSIEITHLGVTGELYLSDLDLADDDFIGQRYQVYIDDGETLELPVTDRVVISLLNGSLRTFLDQGYIEATIVADPASSVPYDNGSSALSSTDVQDALDELASIGSETLRTELNIRNESGSTLTKGTLAAVVGYSVNHSRVLVDTADNRDDTLRPAIGVVKEDVSDGSNGRLVTVGLIEGVDTAAWQIGQQLVLGSNGNFELPPPDQDPFEGRIQTVGAVARVDASEGAIEVNPDGVSPLRAAGVFSSNETFLRGLIEGGSVSPAGGLDLDITAGVGYLTDSNNKYERVLWSDQTITMPASSTSHVYVTEDGSVQTSSSRPNFDQNIVLAIAVSNSSEVTLVSCHKTWASEKTKLDHAYSRDVVGPITVSGCITTVNGSNPLRLDVDGGVYYVTDNRREISGNAPITFTEWYRDGSGGWVSSLGNTQVDTANYDDGSGTLASIPAGEYKKDVVYITCSSGNPQYHLVYGQQTFSSQENAEGGAVPIPPDELQTFGLQTGGVVVQEGSSSIASISDERPFLGQFASQSTSVTSHGNLSGLSDDDHPLYYPVDGSRSLTGDLDVGTNNVSNVNLVDGVDVSNHASRHTPGSTDALPTDAPFNVGTINVEGSASSFARSDHVHAHGDQPGGSLHDDATTSTDGFMSSTDKTKLDGIESGATADQTINAGLGLAGGGTGDVTLDVDLSNLEASDTNTVSTTSTTDVLIPSMSIAPTAGTYLAMFSATVTNLDNNESVFCSLWVGGAKIVHTDREITDLNNDWDSVSMQSIITLNGAEDVEARFRTSAGGESQVRERTLTVVQIS